MLNFFLGIMNPLKIIGDQLNKAYELKLLAMNDRERIAADSAISQLEAQRDVLISEQGHWMTRWIRPSLAAPCVIYWWKIIVWDTVLGWGTTPDPGEYVTWFAMMIPGTYFMTRPIEKMRRYNRS